MSLWTIVVLTYSLSHHMAGLSWQSVSEQAWKHTLWDCDKHQPEQCRVEQKKVKSSKDCDGKYTDNSRGQTFIYMCLSHFPALFTVLTFTSVSIRTQRSSFWFAAELLVFLAFNSLSLFSFTPTWKENLQVCGVLLNQLVITKCNVSVAGWNPAIVLQGKASLFVQHLLIRW